MKLLLKASTILTLTAVVGSPSIAADMYVPEPAGSYVTIFGGYTLPEVVGYNVGGGSVLRRAEMDGGFLFGGAWGTYLTPSLRGEIEASYQQFSADNFTETAGGASAAASGDMDVFSVMLNVWKDIELGAGLTPYIGGGLGVGIADHSLDVGGPLNGTSAGLTGQLGTGLRFVIGERTTLDLGYRFRSLIDVNAVGESSGINRFVMDSVNTHNFIVGVSYAVGGGAYAQPVAYEGSNTYISVFAGAALPENSALWGDYTEDLRNDTGFSVGAAIGTLVAPGLRTELEASYTEYNQVKGSCCADTLTDADGNTAIGMILANVWKDIPLGPLSPYIGGGLGLAIASAELEPSDADEVDGIGVGLGLQFGAGMRFAVSDSLLFDLGYRLKGAYGITLRGAEGNDEHANVAFLTHVVQAGVTWSMGGTGIQPVADFEPARRDLYVTAFGGGTLPSDWMLSNSGSPDEVNLESGFIVGAAIGTHLLDSVRGEIELAYSQTSQWGWRDRPADPKCDIEVDNRELSYVSLMVNAWKDFNMGTFSPYVGGGIGMAFIDPDIDMSEEFRDDAFAMAAQVGAGVRVAVSDNLTLDAGYRFKALMDPLLSDFAGDTSNDHSVGTHYSHNLVGGLSWGF